VTLRAALSRAATCHPRLATDGWTEDPEKSHLMAGCLARQSLQVGENDPSIPYREEQR
jgi:hypothetical protein